MSGRNQGVRTGVGSESGSTGRPYRMRGAHSRCSMPIAQMKNQIEIDVHRHGAAGRILAVPESYWPVSAAFWGSLTLLRPNCFPHGLMCLVAECVWLVCDCAAEWPGINEYG